MVTNLESDRPLLPHWDLRMYLIKNSKAKPFVTSPTLSIHFQSSAREVRVLRWEKSRSQDLPWWPEWNVDENVAATNWTLKLNKMTGRLNQRWPGIRRKATYLNPNHRRRFNYQAYRQRQIDAETSWWLFWSHSASFLFYVRSFFPQF